MRIKWLIGTCLLLGSITFQSCDRKEEPVIEEIIAIEEPEVPVASDSWDNHELVNEEPTVGEESIPAYFPSTRLLLDEDQIKSIDPANDFTLNFIRDIYKEGNVLLSPLGIQTVLAMASNQDSAAASISDILGFGGDDINEVNDFFKNLIGDLTSERCEKELKFSNALMADVWAPKYSSGYLDLLKEYYFADYIELEAKPLEEQPVGSRPEDSWCKEKTDGLISSSPLPILAAESALLNAVCFNGEWEDKFDKEKTWPDLFFVNSEKSISLPMMHKTGRFTFYKNKNFRSVSLFFGDGAFDLSIILPESPFNISQLLDSLNSATWRKMRKEIVNKPLLLSIPSFTDSYSIEIPLSGFGKAFQDRGGVIAQKAFFKIDEEGASAAAATEQKTSISPGEPNGLESFEANTPFIYTISESGSGLILFIGIYSGADKIEE